MSTTSTHREIIHNHGIESKLPPINSISIHGCSLHSSLFALALPASIMLQCTKEGVYIRFPSRKLKLSNLQLNSYLTTLNLLNAFLSTKDKSLKAQGPLHIQSVLLYE